MNENDPIHSTDWDAPANREQIIAYVCRTMSPDEQTRFATRMIDDTELARRVEALRKVLAPLAQWTAPEPAADQIDRIMACVNDASPLKLVASSAPMSPPIEESASVRRGHFTLPQFFAVAASIALLLSIFVPVAQRQHDRQMQQACVSSLFKLGTAGSAYAHEYNGMPPRVAGNMQRNWLALPARHNLEPLLTLQFVNPRTLVCPTTPLSDADVASAKKYPNAFLQRMDLAFYSVQHPDGRPAAMTAHLGLPLFADSNPLFGKGRVATDVDETANSPAHRGRGQNVLFPDIRAAFLNSPQFQGSDNIWRAENVKTYNGTEAPSCATDSFLIP